MSWRTPSVSEGVGHDTRSLTVAVRPDRSGGSRPPLARIRPRGPVYADEMADPPARHADKPPARWKRWGCLMAVVGLAAAIALAPIRTKLWDGGFEPAEYRPTFTDSAGRPVPGVMLRVLTRAGGPSYLYPVDEFLPDQARTSDADGRMTFHHVGSGLEFGGADHGSLLGIWYTRDGSPQYVCVFSHGGREVARIPYDDLRPRDPESDRLPTVHRAWRHTDWPLREYVAHRDDWQAHRLRLFDGDGNGDLDREERVAAGYFDELIEPPSADRIGFAVVERTVVVPGR